MDGLSKIDFNLEKQPLKQNSSSAFKASTAKADQAVGTQMKKRKVNFDFKKFLKSRKLVVIIGLVLLLILFVIFGIILPARSVYNSAKITYKDAQAASYAIKIQDVTLASDQLAKTKQDLEVTKKGLLGMGY